MTVQELILELCGLMAVNEISPNDTIAVSLEDYKGKVNLGCFQCVSMGTDDFGKGCVFIDGSIKEIIHS